MKKNVIKVILLVLVIILFTEVIIFANTNTNQMACALISTERGGIESEGDRAMLNAKIAYDSKGYSTNILKDPDSILILSNAMASEVQLYCCHGTSERIEFPSGGLKVGNTTIENGKTFYSIGNINWSDKNLVVLAACYTGVNGGIAQSISNLGANTTIGWNTEINAFSTPDWLDNFHRSIQDRKFN